LLTGPSGPHRHVPHQQLRVEPALWWLARSNGRCTLPRLVASGKGELRFCSRGTLGTKPSSNNLSTSQIFDAEQMLEELLWSHLRNLGSSNALKYLPADFLFTCVLSGPEETCAGITPDPWEDQLSLKNNRLLASLSGADLEHLKPNLKEVLLDPATTLFEPQDRISHAYFLWDGVVSLMAVGEDGTLTQVATVGSEGVVGLGGILAGEVSFTRQVVQFGGHGVRIARAPFVAAVNTSETMRTRMFAHMDAFTAQGLQSVACNALHSVEERLARWLLTASDRSGQPMLPVTHRAIAEILAVQRSTITLVARMMNTAGLIRHERGSITILDRDGLEELTCECYGIIKRVYDEAHAAN
jgi:CRP-like cAMP-binding protein